MTRLLENKISIRTYHMLHKHSFHPKHIIKRLLKSQIILFLERDVMRKTLIRHGIFMFKSLVKEIVLNGCSLVLKANLLENSKQNSIQKTITNLISACSNITNTVTKNKLWHNRRNRLLFFKRNLCLSVLLL